MVAGDPRECRPVDAPGLHALPRIDSLVAQPHFVAGAGIAPQAIEYRSALRVEGIDSEDCDVPVLRIDPRERGPRHAHESKCRQQKPQDPRWPRARRSFLHFLLLS